MKQPNREVDVNTPISAITNTWKDSEHINQMRQEIADALVQQCIDNGLTVATAYDVLARAKKKLEQLVNGFPVAGLCTRPSSQTDSQTL